MTNTEVVSGIVPVKDLEKLLGLSYSRIQAVLTELEIERFRGTSGAAKFISQEDFVMLQEFQQHTKSGGTLQDFKSTYVRQFPTRPEPSQSVELTPVSALQDNTQDYPMGSLALATALENAVRNALPQKAQISLKERLETLLLVSQEQIPLQTKDLAELLNLAPTTIRSKGETFSLYGFEFRREKTGRENCWFVSRQ